VLISDPYERKENKGIAGAVVMEKERRLFFIVPFRGPVRGLGGGARHGAHRHLSGVLEVRDGSAVCAFSEGVGLFIMRTGADLSQIPPLERREWCLLNRLSCSLVVYT
jgi:hypothetical protein